MTQALILCGGKGIRFKKYSDKNKQLEKIYKTENLINIVEQLNKNGIKNKLFLTGKDNYNLENFIKKNFKNFKIIRDKNFFGTGGAVFETKNFLIKDTIIIMGDLFINFNFKKFIKISKKYDGSIMVHSNSHPYDSDRVLFNNDFVIKKIISKKSKIKTFNHTIAGIFYLKKKCILSLDTKKKKYDLVNDIFKKIIQKKYKILAYKSIEFVKDYGTRDRVIKLKQSLKRRQFKKNIFSKKKKAIFLDRDGVINKEIGGVNNLKNFKIINKIPQTIKKINEMGIPVFIVSNQSGLAKKKIKISDFEKIIQYLDNLLAKKGAYIDDYKYCPHYIKGIRFKKKKYYFSNFRKPNPGMIKELAKKYDISLKNSFFVGDTDLDMLAAKRANISNRVLVKGSKLKMYKFNVQPITKIKNLSQILRLI